MPVRPGGCGPRGWPDKGECIPLQQAHTPWRRRAPCCPSLRLRPLPASIFPDCERERREEVWECWSHSAIRNLPRNDRAESGEPHGFGGRSASPSSPGGAGWESSSPLVGVAESCSCARCQREGRSSEEVIYSACCSSAEAGTCRCNYSLALGWLETMASYHQVHINRTHHYVGLASSLELSSFLEVRHKYGLQQVHSNICLDSTDLAFLCPQRTPKQVYWNTQQSMWLIFWQIYSHYILWSLNST